MGGGGGDDMNFRRPSSYFSGCTSPSCVSIHEEYYSRISSHQRSSSKRSSQRLRKMIKKLMNESSKGIYGSKPLTFQYDSVSYSQNFDDGLHKDDHQYPNVSGSFSRFQMTFTR